MISKVYIECIKRKPDDTDGYLTLRSKGRENPTRKSIGLKVNYAQFRKYWNDKDQRFKSGMPNYKLLNEKVEEAFDELQKTSGEIIKLPKSNKSFLKFWEQEILLDDNYGSKVKHQVVKTKLEKYLKSIKKTDLLFSQITPEFVRSLQVYLTEAKDPKKLSTNTVTHYLKLINIVLERKLKEEPRLFLIHPFTGIEYKHNVDAIKRSILTDDEVDSLLQGELSDGGVNQARNMFVFALFSKGMRMSDLLLLKWDSIKTNTLSIDYTMYKTRKFMNAPLTINMCMILMEQMGQLDRAYQLLEDTLYPIGDKISYFKGKILRMDEMDSELLKLCISTPEGVNYSATKTDDVIEYKGYTFNSDNQDVIKKTIDYVEKHKDNLHNILIEETALCVDEYVDSNKCKDKFVFPYLNNELFKGVKGGDNLSDDLAKHLQSEGIVYNRHLKDVADALGIKSRLSSHVARHTYTQLLIDDGDVKTHEISEQLGHQNIATTDSYTRHKFRQKKSNEIAMRIGNNRQKRKK